MFRVKIIMVIVSLFLVIGCLDTLDKGAIDLANQNGNSTNDTNKTVVEKWNPIDSVSGSSGRLKILGGKVYTDSIRVDFRYDSSITPVWLKMVDSASGVLVNSKDSVLCPARDTLNFKFPPNRDSFVVVQKAVIPGKTYKMILQGRYKGNLVKTDTTFLRIPVQDTSVIDTISDTSGSTTKFVAIDAVSSASKKHKIIGGKAYSDSAHIDFSFFYANGTATLYLVDKASQGNIASVKLTGAYTKGATNVKTFTNLLPGKTYECYMKAVYGSTTVSTPKSTFTTPLK